MPAPRELPQQIPPGQKLECKSPRVGANFWCKSPGMRGGMVMAKIDSCTKPEINMTRTNGPAWSKVFRTNGGYFNPISTGARSKF